MSSIETAVGSDTLNGDRPIIIPETHNIKLTSSNIASSGFHPPHSTDSTDSTDYQAAGGAATMGWSGLGPPEYDQLKGIDSLVSWLDWH